MKSRRVFVESCLTAFAVSLCRAADKVQDPWAAAELMEPGELAKRMAQPDLPLHIICVAFPALYKQRHIAGAVLAGPGSKPEGIETLRSSVEKLPKSDLIVLYCGCCPMQNCPNVRPAYSAIKHLGLTNLRVLNLANNFHTDWTTQGYPVG